MNHPWQALLVGWIVMIGSMVACFHPRHTFSPESADTQGRTSAMAEAEPPSGQTSLLGSISASGAISDSGSPPSVDSTDQNEDSKQKENARKESEIEEVSSREHVDTGSDIIDSHDHAMLTGIEIPHKYLPLVRNRGEHRKYETKVGIVSYCDEEQQSASSKRFDPDEMVGAHTRYPFGSIVRCTNLSNNKSATVLIVDRGPYVEGRILDLSEAAGRKIGMLHKGVTRCRVEVLAYPQKKD